MDNDLYNNTFRIKSTRLSNFNYAANAYYFITICTKDRKLCFGNIINNEMILSESGKIANQYWLDIPKLFPFIILDEFVIMPNHVHGIILINKPQPDLVETQQCCVSSANPVNNEAQQCCVSTNDKIDIIANTNDKIANALNSKEKNNRWQNIGAGSLSTIVRSYKSAASNQIRKNINPDFHWQERFNDRIIRDLEALNNIREYIKDNPWKWDRDRNNPNNFNKPPEQLNEI